MTTPDGQDGSGTSTDGSGTGSGGTYFNAHVASAGTGNGALPSGTSVVTGAADDAEVAAVKAQSDQNAQAGSSAGQTSGSILSMAQALWGQFQSIQGLYNTLSKEQKDLVLDLVGLAFDIGGIFEPTPTFDVLSTALSGARGDYSGAFVSFLGVIPYVGDAAKLVKIPRYLDRATTCAPSCLQSPDDGVRDGGQEDHDLGLRVPRHSPIE